MPQALSTPLVCVSARTCVCASEWVFACVSLCVSVCMFLRGVLVSVSVSVLPPGIDTHVLLTQTHRSIAYRHT